jgi:hypothetical protein
VSITPPLQPLFRTGAEAAEAASKKRLSMAAFDQLTEAEKQQLCEELLAEFGATVVKVNHKGELIHSCCLPFGHRDSSPSAALNYRTLQYNCYACGGGSLVWFIATCRGEDTDAARRWLTKTTGVNEERPLEDLLRFFDALWNPVENRRPPIPQYNPSILDPWMLIHPYLTEIRGIPEANIEHFKTGWNPTENRIVIPHFWKGKLVGWQSRRLANDGSEKYHNTVDFPRDLTLYNYDPSAREIILCESTLSVVRHWHQAPNLVATFGAEISPEQMRYFGRHDRVILWFDNDAPGWKATKTVGDALLGFCDHVRVVDSPWAADPADMDDATFDQLLGQTTPYALWHQPQRLQEWSPS